VLFDQYDLRLHIAKRYAGVLSIMKKILACFVIAAVPTVGAAQSLVCAGKIIGEGVTQAEVSARCGTPTQADHRTSNLAPAIGSTGEISSDDVTQVEVWTYNFGPNKLMQRIWFEGGIVKRVESLGYGHSS
jgi:hypothetical protein